MTITALDRDAALIVIDLQQAIANVPLIAPLDLMVGQANRLSDAFRGKGLPVVNVVADNVRLGRNDHGRASRSLGPGGTDLLPSLRHVDSDYSVLKNHWGAFTETNLHAYLQERGVTQLVVVGVATSAGVESTVRHAAELDYNIAVAIDAVTDTSVEAHAHSISVIFPKITETGTTQQILDALSKIDSDGS